MKKTTSAPLIIECEHIKTIKKLNEIINLDNIVNVVKIDCSYGLLRWSTSPLICKTRHNVVISSVKHSEIIKKVSNISVICSTISRFDLIKKLTTLSMLNSTKCTKSKGHIILNEADLNFYAELSSLTGKIGKYRSNKKRRLSARLGLKGDYELTLFFNMIYSLPYSFLRVSFVKENLMHPSQRDSEKLIYRSQRFNQTREETNDSILILY